MASFWGHSVQWGIRRETFWHFLFSTWLKDKSTCINQHAVLRNLAPNVYFTFLHSFKNLSFSWLLDFERKHTFMAGLFFENFVKFFSVWCWSIFIITFSRKKILKMASKNSEIYFEKLDLFSFSKVHKNKLTSTANKMLFQLFSKYSSHFSGQYILEHEVSK